MPTEAPLLSTAQATLLAPFDLRAPAIDSVLGGILTHRVDYADLYFQYSRSEGWSLEEGIVKSGSFNIDQGVGVRAIAGDKTAFAYSDEISIDALNDAAGATRAIARAGKSGRVPAIRHATGRDLYRPMDPLGSLADTE
jgi:TldD protein